MSSCIKPKCHFTLFFILYVLKCVFSVCDIPSASPFPRPYHEGNRQTLSHSNYFYREQIPKKDKIEINCHHALQIFILWFGVISLLCFSYINLCIHVSYVTYNTDLNLYSKKKNLSFTPMYLDVIISRYVRVALK